jgi:hypothetical protein
VPTESVDAYTSGGDEADPPDAAALDIIGTEAFIPIIGMIVPENHHPARDQLHDGVRRNWPIDLGGGWYLGFDRNMASRTLHIVYSTAEG